MPCWMRTQRVSVNDEFVCEVRCDEGHHSWMLSDDSGYSGRVVGSGDGPVPSQHLPLGTSMDGVPWTERLPMGWQHLEPRVRETWPEEAK